MAILPQVVLAHDYFISTVASASPVVLKAPSAPATSFYAFLTLPFIRYHGQLAVPLPGQVSPGNLHAGGICDAVYQAPAASHQPGLQMARRSKESISAVAFAEPQDVAISARYYLFTTLYARVVGRYRVVSRYRVVFHSHLISLTRVVIHSRSAIHSGLAVHSGSVIHSL